VSDVIDKVVGSVDEAVSRVRDGDVVLVGGSGSVGVPQALIAALIRLRPRGLTIVSNNSGSGELAAGKEIREINGRTYVFEEPLRGDVALVSVHIGDRLGNLRHRRAARNFNPVMATAATTTIAQVDWIASPGELDPDDIHTPGIFVDFVVQGDRGGRWE
jgi:acyl CoA:acetate/3-ketoacid CoA transferase alpha subunit